MTLNRTRFLTITQEIPRTRTGLNGKLFAHLSYDRDGHFHELSFSEKGKDQSTLDKVLDALGEASTEMLAEIGL